jgi:hypothetical protein
MSDVTPILNAIEHSDPHAAGESLPLVHNQLRELAAHTIAHETSGPSLKVAHILAQIELNP